MSGLTPYLAGGLVQTDASDLRARRQLLNPLSIGPLSQTSHPGSPKVTTDRLPVGAFDAAEWASYLLRELLTDVFFGGAFPGAPLGRFLAPLDRRLPAPFVRRPRLFHMMNAELGRSLRAAQPHTLIKAFAEIDGGVDEARVALSAAYDTTAHTLAWVLWHLAENADCGRPEMLPSLVDETLRLYPAGWVGSRICCRPVTLDDVPLKPGTLVMYSPYLAHRDPTRGNMNIDAMTQAFLDALPKIKRVAREEPVGRARRAGSGAADTAHRVRPDLQDLGIPIALGGGARRDGSWGTRLLSSLTSR